MFGVKRHFTWVSFLLVSILFYAFPQIDLTVSGWFYDAGTQHWWGEGRPLVESLYAVFRYIPYFLVPVLLAAVCIAYFPSSGFSQYHKRIWVFLLVTLLAGPGILVHSVFKEGFDRPRPKNIEQFDGKKAFSAAYVINHECRGGCNSFISGHAAMGFWFMVFAWTLRSRAWLWFGLGVGVTVSGLRIIEGGHFLSDTLISGYICYFTFKLSNYFLLEKKTA